MNYIVVRNRILILLSIAILVLSISGTALAAWTILAIPNFSQQPYDKICWATTASMIIAFFKGDTIDRDIDIAKLKWGSNFNQGATISDTQYYVRYYTGKAGSIQNNPLSYTAVQYQTNNYGPIGCGLSLARGGGHMVVIKGYDTKLGIVFYNDPWDGKSYGVTHSYMVSNSKWNWAQSLFYK